MMNTHPIVVCAFAATTLLGTAAALAEDKPKESFQFNYGKVEYENTTQRDVSTGQATGKRMHKPFSVTKELDQSSPKLMQSSSPGGGGKPTGSQNLLGSSGGAGTAAAAGSKTKLPTGGGTVK
jgi:hypothetical protein